MTAHMEPAFLTPAPLSGAALTKGQFVKYSSGKVVAAGAGERGIGFIQATVSAADKPASIAVPGGGALAIAGGTIAAGDSLKSDASGHLVATTTADDIIVAIAEESAVDNDVFRVRPTFAYKY